MNDLDIKCLVDKKSIISISSAQAYFRNTIGPNDNSAMQVLCNLHPDKKMSSSLHPAVLKIDNSYRIYYIYNHKINITYFLTKLEDSPVIDDLEIQAPALLICFVQGY